MAGHQLTPKHAEITRKLGLEGGGGGGGGRIYIAYRVSGNNSGSFNVSGGASAAGAWANGSAGSAGTWTFVQNAAVPGDQYPPTDIALSSNSVCQSNGVNAVVGTLSTADQDAGDSFTYSLVSGTGSTDNGSFNISANTLRANNAAAMAPGNYSVRIRTTDQVANTFDKVFAISVIDTPPFVISIARFNPTNATAGIGSLIYRVTFDESVTNVSPSAFRLTTTGATVGTIGSVSTTGGTNIVDVSVSGVSGPGTLRLDLLANSALRDLTGNPAPGYAGGDVYCWTNHAPTDIALSQTSVNQTPEPNVTVGLLSTTDPDVGDSFTYSLVSGIADVSVCAPPPVVAPIPEHIAYVLLPLVLTNQATDTYLPLSFGLGAGAPPGASINPTNGVFTFTPSRELARTTNLISVLVTNSGAGIATNTFTVVVDDYVEVGLGRMVLRTGQSNSVPLTLCTSAHLTNVQVLIQAPEECLQSAALSEVAPGVDSAGLQHLGFA